MPLFLGFNENDFGSQLLLLFLNYLLYKLKNTDEFLISKKSD